MVRSRRIVTPRASSRAVSDRMRRVPQRDTAPEIALRRILHARGLRYFVNRRPLPNIRSRADIVFPTRKVAVFVDGCFWHGCPLHATWPIANAGFWRTKIETNRRRDWETDHLLRNAGWKVVRVWSHLDPRTAADRIESRFNQPVRRLSRRRWRARSRGQTH